ncbi:HAUS augmin-like complex subunit 1 [Chlamydotis macqueenii]
MEEKFQRVTLCLKKIYGNQHIPQYKVNARIANILYELVECNESRDRDVSLLTEDMKQKATQYEAEANSLQGLLTESLDLSLSSLSSEGTSYLNVLVNSAMTLETKDTSLARDLKKTEELLEVEKAKADSRSQNLKFLKDKSEDLKIRIKAAEVGCPRRVLIYDKYKDPFSSFTENCISSDYLVLIVSEVDSESHLSCGFSFEIPSPFKEVRSSGYTNAFEAEFSKQSDMLTLEMPEPSKLQFT